MKNLKQHKWIDMINGLYFKCERCPAIKNMHGVILESENGCTKKTNNIKPTDMKITVRTPFEKVQAKYPDAIKGEFITNKPMEYIAQGIMNCYRIPNMSNDYAKCLLHYTNKLANGDYKNIFIFSVMAKSI